MNKHLLPVLTGLALIMTGCSTNNGTYQYPFKSAKIEYAISGTTEGKSVVTMKGDKSVREAHIVFHKPSGDENQSNLYIDEGKYVYSIDLEKKTGTMTKNPLYEVLSATEPAKRQELLKKVAVGISPDESSTKELKIVGHETIAGKECDVYETGGFGQICLWNAIPLKTNISIPDLGLNNNTIATSIQVDLDVPDATFDVPAGITVQKINVDEDGSQQIKNQEVKTGTTQQ